MTRLLIASCLVSAFVAFSGCGNVDVGVDAGQDADVLAVDTAPPSDALTDSGTGDDAGRDGTVPDTFVPDTVIPPDVNQPDATTDVCVPDCDWRECGDDGCGGDCGFCEYGTVCDQGECWISDYPDCDGRECGDDGIGGSCGECPPLLECDNLAGRCMPTCIYPQDIPDEFGPASIVNYLHVPADAAEKAVCFDYSGDGQGDCGSLGQVSTWNSLLDQIDVNWKSSYLLEFALRPAIIAPIETRLNALIASPVVAGSLGGDVLVDPDSWNPDTCQPFMSFDDAQVVDGAISANASQASVFVNVSPSFALRVDLIDIHMTGTYLLDESGVSIVDGVFCAIMTSQDFYAAVERLQAECDKEPTPADLAEICQYLQLMYAPGPRIVGPDYGFMILHRKDDGTYVDKDAENHGNAAPICLKFSTAPATITGLVE